MSAPSQTVPNSSKWSEAGMWVKEVKIHFHLVIPNRRTGTEEIEFHFAYTAGGGVQMLLWTEGRYWGYWEPRVEQLHHLTLPIGNKLFVYLTEGSCSEVGLATSDRLLPVRTASGKSCLLACFREAVCFLRGCWVLGELQCKVGRVYNCMLLRNVSWEWGLHEPITRCGLEQQ